MWATKALLSQLQLAVTDSQLDDCVSDVKEWAELEQKQIQKFDADCTMTLC